MPLATQEPAKDGSKFDIQIDGKMIQFTTTRCDDTHPNFRSYTCQNAQGKKAFLVELKAYKDSKHYNFGEFRVQDMKDANAELVLNFIVPDKSTLTLPAHMRCITPPQRPDVTINGQYEKGIVIASVLNKECFKLSS